VVMGIQTIANVRTACVGSHNDGDLDQDEAVPVGVEECDGAFALVERLAVLGTAVAFGVVAGEVWVHCPLHCGTTVQVDLRDAQTCQDIPFLYDPQENPK
jgi:hypothetical protein